MLLKRLYRFVLKRLIGPFLVNNDIAIKDLDVKLRDRTVELRNLQLDIDVLNETLGLGEVKVASASIANVTLSGKDGFSVKVSGVRVVLNPRGSATRTKSTDNEQDDIKLARNLDDIDDELDDLDKLKAASKPTDGSSLSEGLSSVESWIERSINMLKVEISDVLVEIRLLETAVASPYYLTIFVESCESQTNFDAAVRQTELFGVHVSLRSTDSSDEIRLVYVEPSRTVDGKVCLIRAALDESFKERGYEISLFAVYVNLSPQSLASLLELVSRFSACNVEQTAIRASAATPDGSDDEFFDALSSFAQSGISKSMAFSEEPKKQLLVGNNKNNSEQKTAPTIFRLELNTVSILASFGNEQSIRFECQGVVVTQAMFSINNLLCKIEGEDSDLMFDISKPADENAIVFDVPSQKLSLFAMIGMITSNKFKTLSHISASYGNLSLTNVPEDPSSSSTLITPATSTSRWHLEAGREVFVRVQGEVDDMVLRIFDINLDAMGFSARDGSLNVQAKQNNKASEPAESSPAEDIVVHLDKSITMTFVDNSSIATAVTTHEPSRVKRERDFEQDDTDDLGEVVTEFENTCLKMASMVLDVTVGMIRTPEELDPELFQRILAIIVTSGPTPSTELSESALIEPLTKFSGLPFFRISCPHGRFSFAKAKSLPGCSLEFRDFSSLSYGTDSAVKIQHLSLAEKLEGHPDCSIAPILFSSRFASESVSSATAMIEMKTLSDLSVKIALCGYTFRFEPRSQGLLALSTFMVPDGRTSTMTTGFRTDIRLMIDSWVVDVFPSQSPFAMQKEIASGLPQGRLLATVGKMQIATCETLANLWRYDIDVMDAHLYLAKRSAREPDEHVYVVSRGPGLMIHEYAELNGFVRIGEMHFGQFFLRAEGIMWDMVEVEAVVPMFRLMTCVDSLIAFNALLARTSAEIPSHVATAGTMSGPSSPRSPQSACSPILILQRSTSAVPALDLMQNMHHTVPDSELPASALRSRALNAPDSSLNAKQLQARYKKEPYLLPHVIDDYYSIGSLPTEPRRDRPEYNGFEEEGKAKLLGKPRSSSDDLLDDFDIISVSPTPPPIVEKSVDVVGGRGPNKLRNDVSLKVNAASSSILPPTTGFASSINKAQPEGRQTIQRKRKTFLDDDDEDEEEDNNEEDDGMMMHSVLFTAPPSSRSPKESSTYKPSRSFAHEEDDNDEEDDEVMMSGGEPPAVQLIELSEITSKAKHGSTEAMQLQQSIMGLVETTAEAGKDSNDMAENEANLYKTALLASSAALTREASGTTNGQSAAAAAVAATAGEGMWYPGKLLVHHVDSEDEEDEEEEDGAARYFDEDGGQHVQVRTHHFPVPVLAKPGSFLPPQPVLAARIEVGGDLKDTAIRGRLRIILRDCSFTWSLFGGHDFAKDDLALFEPIYGIESTSKDVRIVENHFQAGQQPLFGTEATKPSFRTNSWAVGRRDVNRVAEIVAERISLLLDSFGDGASALSLAIHQLELIDAVKVSPVKKLFQHWENEKLHPRFTAEDMVRFTLDISAKNNYQMHAAFLPVRLMINQDTLDLLNSFSDGLKALNPPPSSSSSSASVPPPIVELADFRAVKLKIDYYPKRVDLTRVRQGKYAELIHLFSYEGMEVALKRAQIRGSRGFDQLGASLAEYWAQDVLNKQLYQLLAGLSPTLKNVATDMADIVLLPADLFRGKATSATAGIKAQKFAKTIVIEGCGIGKKVASAALNLLDDTRMKKLPKGMPDGLNVAAQAMASRAKHVHHTIVAVPLTVWQREGTTGALKSVIRAIPVAVIQPVLGLGEAVEAISSGIQFHIDPDQYKEESRRWKHSTT